MKLDKNFIKEFKNRNKFSTNKSVKIYKKYYENIIKWIELPTIIKKLDIYCEKNNHNKGCHFYSKEINFEKQLYYLGKL